MPEVFEIILIHLVSAWGLDVHRPEMRHVMHTLIVKPTTGLDMSPDLILRLLSPEQHHVHHLDWVEERLSPCDADPLNAVLITHSKRTLSHPNRMINTLLVDSPSIFAVAEPAAERAATYSDEVVWHAHVHTLSLDGDELLKDRELFTR